MRYTQFNAFEKHLHSATPANLCPLYALLVKDPAERVWIFDQLKGQLDPLNITVYAPDLAGVRQLIEDLFSLSLFSGKTLFHIPDCEKLPKEAQGLLEKKLSALSSATPLVLSGESLVRQGAFFKAIEKQGVILDSGEEKPWEKERSLAEWVVERARREGYSIDSSAVNALARGVQGNLGLLAAEWEKLKTFAGESSVLSHKDVQAICHLTLQDSNWALGEAILAQDSKTALEIAERMIEKGSAPVAILRSLRHQIVTAFLLASADEEGKRSWAMEKFPYLKGQMFEKQMQTARRFGSEKLSCVIQTIDDFEFQAKDSLEDPKLLLTLLCAKVL